MKPSLYQFRRNAQHQYVFGLDCQPIIPIRNAPTDTDWSRWTTANDAGGNFLVFCFQAGTFNLYQFNLYTENGQQYLEYNPAVPPIPVQPDPDVNTEVMGCILNMGYITFYFGSFSSKTTLWVFLYLDGGTDYISKCTLRGFPADTDYRTLTFFNAPNKQGCVQVCKVDSDVIYMGDQPPDWGLDFVYKGATRTVKRYPRNANITRFSAGRIGGVYGMFLSYDAGYDANLLSRRKLHARATASYNLDDHFDWQASLSNEKLISDVNLPGTHDSAAIGRYVSFWICQDYTIWEQLICGIRLFDIRLQVRKDQAYYFVTCHGNLGSDYLKTFQTYQSVLDDFRDFLARYPTEFIVMSLKIDDYNGFGGDKLNVCRALSQLASGYGDLFYPVTAPQPTTPTVRQMRGKIYVLNRVSARNDVGVPVSWADNTTGSLAVRSLYRDYAIYVQDHYTMSFSASYEADKLGLFTAAWQEKSASGVLLNFGSSLKYLAVGVYIQYRLLLLLLATPADARPETVGWSFFDYALSTYYANKYGRVSCVDLIIDSNKSSIYPDSSTFYKDDL